MTAPFTAEQIDQLSVEIEEQLLEVRSSETLLTRTTRSGGPPLAKQLDAISRTTGEDADSFLKRFREAARRDVCEEGGVIYKQWNKWRDVTKKDVLEKFGAILVGMGLAGSGLQIAVVAIAVYVLHLGIEAFCAGG